MLRVQTSFSPPSGQDCSVYNYVILRAVSRFLSSTTVSRSKHLHTKLCLVCHNLRKARTWSELASCEICSLLTRGFVPTLSSIWRYFNCKCCFSWVRWFYVQFTKANKRCFINTYETRRSVKSYKWAVDTHTFFSGITLLVRAHHRSLYSSHRHCGAAKLWSVVLFNFKLDVTSYDFNSIILRSSCFISSTHWIYLLEMQSNILYFL